MGKKWAFGFVLSLLLIFRSRSASSIFFLILFEVLFLYFKLLERRSTGLKLASSSFGLAFLVLAFNVFNLDHINQSINLFLTLFKKDKTLSGRTVIWDLVVKYIHARPLFGYGLDSFWLGEEGYSGHIAAVRGIVAINAHNGYLDLLLSLGLIGLFLFSLSFIKGVKNISSIKGNCKSYYLFFLCFSIFLLISNLSESTILERSSIFWVMFTIFSLSKLSGNLITKMPLFSVIVPLYNKEKSVCRAIDSILSQSI
jgi:O-antigen ligase